MRRLPESFACRKRAVDLASRARAVPQLHHDQLITAPRVPGHGDFHGANLRVERSRQGIRVVPVDWVDFGACDPRYELAHFLDSAPQSEDLVDAAREKYAGRLDAAPFEEFLRIGQAMNALVEVGSVARRENAPAMEVELWLDRLETAVTALERQPGSGTA